MIRFSPYLKTEELLSTFTMLLNVLAKMRQFGVHTFSLTCAAAEFHRTETIQVIACQYVEILTDEHVNAVDWSAKENYLKINPVEVARQID